MSDVFRSLIAIDEMAQRHGCGLKPELRAAIEAELRFSSKSAGPISTLPANAELPENVTRLTAKDIADRKAAV